MDQFITSSIQKNSRGSRVIAYFCYCIGVLFIVIATLAYLHDEWPITVFVGGAGVAIALVGFGFQRVYAKQDQP